MPDYAKISQGQNEFTDRDPIVLNLHYGQIDRWVHSGKKSTDFQVLKSENSVDIPVGEKVMISETTFMKWIKLTTFIDRSPERKREFHVKRSLKNIAFILGYSSRMGLYKILKPLYEVGLIDLKETKLNDNNMIDIIVFPHPVYASSNICYLVKCREWEKRNSFGFGLSASGIQAKQDKKQTSQDQSTKEVVHKSIQEPVHKSIQGVVHKSIQEPVNKSVQGVVHKSVHTNDLKSTNDSNISNDSNHLINRLNDRVAKSLDIFLNQEKVTDDEKMMMIEQLLGFEFQSLKYESHHKYFLKTLNSIRNQKPKTVAVKKDKLPRWFYETQAADTPLDENDPEFLEEKAKLDQMMQQYKEKRSS